MEDIEKRFNKKAVYPFSVHGMSYDIYKEFREDAYENFNDNYANKIIFDHMWRKESKSVTMLNDKVDLIYQNLLMMVRTLSEENLALNEMIKDKEEDKEKKTPFNGLGRRT